jgi:hypothetical protein
MNTGILQDGASFGLFNGCVSYGIERGVGLLRTQEFPDVDMAAGTLDPGRGHLRERSLW